MADTTAVILTSSNKMGNKDTSLASGESPKTSDSLGNVNLVIGSKKCLFV